MKRNADHGQHALEIRKNVVVPEADDAEAMRSDVPGPKFILPYAITMLAAIDFDDQATFQANEVNDEPSDGMLASELESVETSRSQSAPEFPLRVG